MRVSRERGGGKHIHTLGTNERERYDGRGERVDAREIEGRGGGEQPRRVNRAARLSSSLSLLSSCPPTDHAGDRRRPSIDSTMSDGPVTPSDEEPNGYCSLLITISPSAPSLISLITITSTDSLIFTPKLPPLRPVNR